MTQRDEHQETQVDTQTQAQADALTHTQADDPTQAEISSDSDASESDSLRTLKPRANLYASEDGWLLIAALPRADHAQTTLETEGTTLTLSAPHIGGGVYQRALRFPRDTVWGDLKARWEGELLYVELPRATPERRSVAIS